MYSPVMDRLLVILCSVLIGVAPIVSGAWRACECDAPVDAPAGSSVLSVDDHGCCPRSSAPSAPDQDTPDDDQDRDTEPGCDCPLGCCGIVHVPAAPATPHAVTFSFVSAPARGIESDQRMGSAHLLGLTRPPRPANTL